ncbi:tautomerase family protein [Prauserella muralis]|uniref:4-oxalocrotonate tautomerase-like domain-containing protein n=1 Tax=Prauserella muralis TaxID=588067 RepID=A0A2V4AG27_9PSEU|nr:tautomerase family protein [Prauserella muralis]PXY18904.1 hypothetical protein BAY60_29150 [Prauserella muralis]TWE28778.1 4-oxalocrotonate tautomerase [Prauserella muralis]
MPRIVVQAYEGRTLDQKRHLVRAITDVVVDAYAVPPETVTVVIEEIRKDHMAKAGVLRSDRDARAESGGRDGNGLPA